MLGILLGAGILGLIVMAVEREDFPGWGKMIVCVLATAIPTIIINALLPPELFIFGLLAGGLSGGFLLMAFCGMTVQRATVAMGIYLGFQIVISTAFYFMTK